MKKYVVLAFVLLNIFANAQEKQEVSVEKNLKSVQLGLLSLSYQNEIRLDRKISFRSEIGLMTGTSIIEHPDGQEEKSFLILPYLNLEPRWYYSLDRRSRLKKNTKNNSSNFISLLTSAVSSRTALVNTKDFETAPFISVIPEFGVRRTSPSGHFFSEYSAGFGYQHSFFNKSFTYKYDENQSIIDIQFKFGYIF